MIPNPATHSPIKYTGPEQGPVFSNGERTLKIYRRRGGEAPQGLLGPFPNLKAGPYVFNGLSKIARFKQVLRQSTRVPGPSPEEIVVTAQYFIGQSFSIKTAQKKRCLCSADIQGVQISTRHVGVHGSPCARQTVALPRGIAPCFLAKVYGRTLI